MIHQDIRGRLEQKEGNLSPFAIQSRLSQGRLRPEVPSPMRTEFQRDRDRIIHSKSFRRLKHKTQVFIAPLGDHFVTRLTHTIEVSQIGRSIGRALNLNEDLVEAIALGHDLGHTPFGHAGEDALNELFPKGFHHNEQSLRVVDHLEKDGGGLNLTREVREGILKHSKTRESILGNGWEQPHSLEAQVCKLADTIAYINHDIADAIRANLIVEEDLPHQARRLGLGHSERINTLVCDVIDSSWAATGECGEKGNPIITMSYEILEAANALRDFLFVKVYDVRSARREAEKARDIVRFLYSHFVGSPSLLPEDYSSPNEGVERQAVDYIAGMTDHFALRLAEELGLRVSPFHSLLP